MIYHLTSTPGAKDPKLLEIHRKAIMDARARGLNYRQMAREFNEKQVPRRKGSRGPWTGGAVMNIWSELNLLQYDLEQAGSTGTGASDTEDLKKSA
jgi:hypothetical protein